MRLRPAFSRVGLHSALLAIVLLGACTQDATNPGSEALAQLPGPTSLAAAVAAATTSSLVINEIMADPAAVADDTGEWFEITNISTAPIDLLNHVIVSGTERHTINKSVSVVAGGYVVLTRGSTSKQTGGITTNYSYGTGITLANAGDVLVLQSPSGVMVDSVAWTSSWTAGTARGVINALSDNSAVGGSNWLPQTSAYGKGDKGTPKLVNNGAVPPSDPTVPATVVVTPGTATVAVGGTQSFAASATNASGAPVTTTFSWSSSNTAVATINAAGSAMGVADGVVTITATAANGVAGSATLTVAATPPPSSVQPLVVQVLDIGQGDAALIRNGTSRVFVDGGSSMARFGVLLDSLGLNNSTIDVVVISHAHLDHYNGLRELFSTSRNITVRYVFENLDASTNTTLQDLRDSVNARVQRGQTILRDTDDPCGDGRSVCTVALAGGAKLHVLRPNPSGSTANNRSTPVKLVGPDSASFSMWFAGDAEHEAQDWFDTAGYDVSPGMRANVLKANHHGSCNGVKSRYLDLVAPDWVTFSVGATNSYGHVHTQTKELFTRYLTPWYRTDVNGTVTFTAPGTPGSGYTISGQKGTTSQNGAPDGTSANSACSAL